MFRRTACPPFLAPEKASALAQRHIADAALAVLLICVAGLRVLFLLTNQLQLSPDEMHYWDWSRRLDIAYYSKGALVAWLIAASTSLFGHGQLGVRLPAVVQGSLFVFLIYRYARARIDPWSALAVAVVVQLVPLVAGLGLAMTTDASVLVCWALALTALAPAVRRGKTSAWLPYGLAAAIGMGAKYTTLLLPLGLLLVTPLMACSRPMLRQRGFWLGQLVAFAGLLPLLLWNSRHGWVNLAHNVGHLGHGSPFEAAQLLLGPLMLTVTQLLLLGPLTALLLLIAAWRSVSNSWRRQDPYPLLLAALGVLLMLVCLLVSMRRPVYANWPLPLVVIAILLLVEAWPQFQPTVGMRRCLLLGSAINGLMLTLAVLPFYGFRFGIPVDVLPTRRLLGWRELTETLTLRETDRLATVDLLISDRYTTASALAHGLQRPAGQVITVAFGTRRMNQYDIWARQDMPRLKGSDALAVLDMHTDERLLLELFSRIESLPPLEVAAVGMEARRYRILMAYGYNGSSLPQPSRR